MPSDGLLELLTLPEAAASADPATWLDAGEQARLATIYAEVRRRQFLGGHWLVRKLACERFGGAPSDWRWDIESNGKPRLLRVERAVDISVSHSGGFVAAAVCREPIGMDLELASRERDWLALARYVLSETEFLAIAALPPGEQGTAFIERWSLHEAWGKRGGEGVLPGRMRRLQFIESEPKASELRTWRVSGGSLALAVSATARFECRGLTKAMTPVFWRCLQSKE